MEQEMDLRNLFYIVRKRFVWLMVIPAVAIIFSGAVSFFVLTPMYEASTTLLIGRAPDQTQIVYQDVLLNRQLISTYSEIARSRSVAESVIKALKLDMSAGGLVGLISISAVRDTEIIAVRVQNADPAMAQRIANQVAKSFSEKIVGYSNIDNVLVIDEAILPGSPVSPKKELNIVIAGVLGIVLAFSLIFILEFMDNTIKTAADVEQVLGLSVISVVPVNENNKGGR